MKTVLLILLSFGGINALGQSFKHFQWDDRVVEFAGVEMKVTGSDKKVIFDGYKDSYIKIQPAGSDPASTLLDIKCSGYFQVQSAAVSSFEYKSDEKGTQIIYIATDGLKMCSLLLYYRGSSQKPDFIVVVGYEDYTKKTSKQLSFTLTGIE